MFAAFQSNGFQSNAFQIIAKVANAVIGGVSKGRKKQHRRFYVEHKNEILVFENANQAQAWVEYQQQLQTLAKSKRKAVIKNLKVEPPLEKIDLSEVKDIAEQYGKSSSVNELLQSNNLADVVLYYKDLLKVQLDVMVKRARDEEDEIEMLLLAL